MTRHLGILMSHELAQKVFEGKKTETRGLVKSKPLNVVEEKK